MPIDFSNLEKMNRDQVAELAYKQGLNVHWKAKKETIVKQIIDFVNNQNNPDPLKYGENKPEEKVVIEVHHNTADEVEAAIAHIKAKKPEFESVYNLVENTWHFRYRGAEDSGNLNIPLKTIQMKATTVALGRRALMARPEFEKGNATGNSAYTNTVLA